MNRVLASTIALVCGVAWLLLMLQPASSSWWLIAYGVGFVICFGGVTAAIWLPRNE